MQRAIIVLGHGSRSAEASAQFMQIIEEMKDRDEDALILPAFMELAEPRLHGVIAQAVTLGATEILVIPCFLYEGIHIKEDIPEMLAALAETHPEVTVRFGRPIGPDPRIAEILLERAEELV